ncbi:MAG: recombination mediator RecR [Bacilli bacterium]|nr:recombination mediator RecR [Bacilli bacterium]
MGFPNSIKSLIDDFKKLPGIGEKTAERLALATLNLDVDEIEKFSNSLQNIKTKIRRCSICNGLSEEEVCEICLDETKEKEIICVVEDLKNVYLIERINVFNGKFHVLDGLISPTLGKGPDDINLESLIKRVKESEVKEIILAFKPSIEGETTALYISKKLKDYNLTISKLAYGLPMGADMDYVDSLTLELALEERKKVS